MSLTFAARHPPAAVQAAPHIPSRSSSLRSSRWSSSYTTYNISLDDPTKAGVAVQKHSRTRSAYDSCSPSAALAPAHPMPRRQVQDQVFRKRRSQPSSVMLDATPSPHLPARSASRKSASRKSASFVDDMNRKSHGAFSSGQVARPQRWDGSRKTHCDWDCLRKDAELWFPDGDCFVHLYEKGHSRRGPSFCISLEALQHANCGPLFSLCFAQRISQSEVPASQLSLLRHPPRSMYELYIPAPEDSMRDDMFRWHMTTRNFFAFIFKKPLVGTHLGGALVELQERLHLFRSSDESNYEDFMTYAEELGYLDMANAPNHALAMLYYSEHYTLQGLWMEAYAHCVGMNDLIYMCSEYEYIPRVTTALITRASLEMDLHLSRVSRTLSNFLEDDFSPANLGLLPGARSHLERFRSFLYQFYRNKYGYWPPPKKSSFPGALYRSMFYDFKGLYDFLVDIDSSHSIQFQKPASGGICVLQNVQAFDQKHSFTPLEHPMPLIPASPTAVSQRGLANLKLGRGQSKSDRRLSTGASLSTATNRRNSTIASAPLVKAYKQFEKEWSIHPKEKVSLSDARRVRWILIYGILQTLISVTRAPQVVRDAETPDYPLCCLTAGTPPWKEPAKPSSYYFTHQSKKDPEVVDTELLEAATDKPLPETPAFQIKPDCEAGHYLTHTSIDHRTDTITTPGVEIPGPLRINTNACITPSKRASLSRNTSYKSIIGRGLSPFSRRNSIQIKPHIQPFCEIQVPGYGNGLNEAIIEDKPVEDSSVPLSSSSTHTRTTSYQTFYTADTPTAPSSNWPATNSSPKSTKNASIHISLSVPMASTTITEPKRTPTLEPSQLDSATFYSAPSFPLHSDNDPASAGRSSSESSVPWSWVTSSRGDEPSDNSEHSSDSSRLSDSSSATSLSAPITPVEDRHVTVHHYGAIAHIEEAIQGFTSKFTTALPSPTVEESPTLGRQCGEQQAQQAQQQQSNTPCKPRSHSISHSRSQSLPHSRRPLFPRKPSISSNSTYSSSQHSTIRPSTRGSSSAATSRYAAADENFESCFRVSAGKPKRQYSRDGKARKMLGIDAEEYVALICGGAPCFTP